MTAPKNPLAIDAKTFEAQMAQLMGSGRTWQSDNSKDKLALQLGGGKTWNVGGGEGRYGSGVYKYDPWSEADQKAADEARANYDAIGGGWNSPDSIGVGTGSKSDRDNMLESWFGSGGATGELRARARGYDTGESGRVEGIPYTQEEWIAALKQDAPGYDPTAAIYRVRGDMSEMLGKPDSRMFMDVGYQKVGDEYVPIGTPSKTYQPSAASENWDMLLKSLAAFTAGSSLATTAAGGAATAGGAGAYTTAAADSQLANAALGGGDWLSNLSMADVNKAVNAVHSAGEGDVRGALASYITPGMLGMSGDMGLGEFGNAAATSAVKSAISGKDPIAGAVSGLLGKIPGMEYISMVPGVKSAVVGAITSALKGGASETEAVAAGKKAAAQAQTGAAEDAVDPGTGGGALFGGVSGGAPTALSMEDPNPWRGPMEDVHGEGIFQTPQAVKSNPARAAQGGSVEDLLNYLRS